MNAFNDLRLPTTDSRSPRPDPDDSGGDRISPTAPAPRGRTLKERIKRHMMMSEGRDAASLPPDWGSGKRRRAAESSASASSPSPPAFESQRSRSAEPPVVGAASMMERASVLEAASALTNLGMAAPPVFAEPAPSSVGRGTFGVSVGTAAARHWEGIVPLSELEISPANAPPSQSLRQPLLPSPHGMGGSALNNDRPPTARKDAEGGWGSARPFASLLGSDIPLTFPQKLMEVLSDPSASDAISWLPHGRGFIILQKRKFAAHVMPRYFKHSKFTSFTRKLNRWGFVRVGRGPEMGAYYHKFFRRGDYLLCTQMRCRSNNKAKAAGKRKDEEGASSPPPLEVVETSPDRDEAMSPLGSGAASSVDGGEDYDAPPMLLGMGAMRSGNGAFSSPLAPIPEGHEPSPYPASLGFGSFGRAFGRQQEILREVESASAPLRRALGGRRSHEGLGWNNTTPSLSSSSSSSGSPRQQPGLPQLSLAQSRSTMQNLLGVDTTPSRSHPLFIAEALQALRLPEGAAPAAGAPSGGDDPAAPPRVRGGARAETPEDPHAAMVAEMRRLDRELRAQRAILDGGKAAAGAPKAPVGGLISQWNVAALYRRINGGQPERRAPDDAPRRPGDDGAQRSKRTYRAVRRASAA